MEDKKADEFFIRPPEMTRWQGMKTFLWNPKSKEFLGRTAKSWFQITIFYIVLYAFLAGFFAAMLMIFYQTLDADKPRWQQDSSRIGNSPGMGFRPQHPSPDILTLEFNKNDEASYQPYLKSLEKYLSTYEANDETLIKCDYGIDVPKDKVCRFPPSENIPTECSNQNGYGFAEGSPCIFLKLNKIYGWQPDCFTTEEIDAQDIPEELKERIKSLPQKAREGNVWVSCEGERHEDQEFLKTVNTTYGVDNNFGFPNYYYPYMNVKGYQAPFVVVRFSSLPKDPLRVICHLWAKNIEFERQYRRGMTLIEIHSKE